MKHMNQTKGDQPLQHRSQLHHLRRQESLADHELYAHYLKLFCAAVEVLSTNPIDFDITRGDTQLSIPQSGRGRLKATLHRDVRGNQIEDPKFSTVPVHNLAQMGVAWLDSEGWSKYSLEIRVNIDVLTGGILYAVQVLTDHTVRHHINLRSTDLLDPVDTFNEFIQAI